jgi:prepilin-type N-terminal cleavage/methylation domain-containing protein
MRYKKNSKGITLLELVIAVVVLGVVAAMAAPQFGGVLPRLKFKSKSRDIVSDMRLTRSDAIAQRVQVGLYFDYSQNEYTMFKDLVNPDLFTYEAGDSVIKTVNLGQDISMYYCDFSDNTVVFKPDGSASGSGNVTIKNNQGNDLANIDVLASTGRVKLTFQYSEED